MSLPLFSKMKPRGLQALFKLRDTRNDEVGPFWLPEQPVKSRTPKLTLDNDVSIPSIF